MTLVEGAATPVLLPSDRTVDVPTYQCRFVAWNGDPALRPLYNRNPKTVASVRGTPLFTELAVLRALEGMGWSGVWIDSYSRRYLSDWVGGPVTAELAREQEDILRRMPEARGCWDIFAWREGDVLFAEVKQQGKDRLTLPQRRWLKAALNAGFALSQFRLVEWTYLASLTSPEG